MSAKRFSSKSSLMAEMQKDLMLRLIKEGKVKCKKDLCKNGICPLVICLASNGYPG